MNLAIMSLPCMACIDQAGNPSSCIDETSTVAGIMDGGTTVQPSNQRTNFSLPADQATCSNTAQFQIRHMTSWPWIVSYMRSTYDVTVTQPATYTFKSLRPAIRR